MKILSLILISLLSNIYGKGSGETDVQEIKNGTITGTINATGVRDARDVVVFIEHVDGTYKPPQENPVIDQLNMVFIPHVLPILVGSSVQFPNSDEVRHNVFSPSKIQPFNLGTYSKGITKEVLFDKTGVVTILCYVHTAMAAFIIVLDNPYFTKTGPDGTFTLKNVPIGKYTLKTWHKKFKEKSKEVIVKEGIIVETDFDLKR
ncbi:MAG: methylamine utilization protein [Candidatus Neomarinimicrobiota bacterium]